jgi:hypothetical protein
VGLPLLIGLGHTVWAGAGAAATSRHHPGGKQARSHTFLPLISGWRQTCPLATCHWLLAGLLVSVQNCRDRIAAAVPWARSGAGCWPGLPRVDHCQRRSEHPASVCLASLCDVSWASWDCCLSVSVYHPWTSGSSSWAGLKAIPGSTPGGPGRPIRVPITLPVTSSPAAGGVRIWETALRNWETALPPQTNLDATGSGCRAASDSDACTGGT